MFGDIFDQFKGKVREAFDFLMKRKSGDLLGVFHRAEIGDIDLVWGSHERHEGLEHIIQDHLIDADDFNSVEELMSIINDVINNGKIEPRESQDKIHIEKDGYRVSIKKQYRDDKGNVLFKKNWVVTAFDTKRKERDKKRTSPRGTLTTPPSNPSERIDGVTLPSSDASSADKSSKSSGNGKGNEGKKAEKPKAKKTEGQKTVEKITGKDVEKPKAKADGIEAGKFSLTDEKRKEIERKAKADGTWMKAPDGTPTRLDEGQWTDVRTEPFKNWFGDWEKSARYRMLIATAPIKLNRHSLTRMELENTYYALNNGENKYDGRNVEFVHETLGKITSHKGFDYPQLIPQLKEIFDNSIPAYFEREYTREGHKAHPNFVGYHNYVGKISDSGRTYYVRFTVQEIKVNKNKKKADGFTPNQLHSAFVSDVEIYNTDQSPVNLPVIDRATDDVVGTKTDTKLQLFIETGKDAEINSSKIVGENGEPVAYEYRGQSDGGLIRVLGTLRAGSGARVETIIELPEGTKWYRTEDEAWDAAERKAEPEDSEAEPPKAETAAERHGLFEYYSGTLSELISVAKKAGNKLKK